MAENYDCIIIGGGAAGFFTAINLAELSPDAKILMLEKSGKTLSKLRISGGGRCNVTQARFSPAEMAAGYPRGSREMKKAQGAFGVSETIQWFQSRGIRLKAEPDGRMFPISDKSETIAGYFENRTAELGIMLRRNEGARQIARHDTKWQLLTDSNEYLASRIVIAGGGSPTDKGYDWLRELGIEIVPPVPSLFTFNAVDKQICALSGVSVENAEVSLNAEGFSQNGPVLITHWGISGPAALKLSAFAARSLAANEYTGSLIINWLGNESATAAELISGARKQLGNKPIHQYSWAGIPKRLQQYLLVQAGIEDPLKRWAELSGKNERALIQMLTAMPLPFAGKSTNKDEFVTAGGIALSEIDIKSFSLKKHPGLYAVGEVLDIDGITGGYNFQAAWTGAMMAARHIAAQLADAA